MRERFYVIFKRVIDIILALILFFPSLILVIVFSILVIINDFGNPILIQKRLGYKGKEFNLIKIRSMVKDAEKNGIVWAKKEDERVLKIGKFIRRTRIDELPQIINVLKGDMSFIGPRPERKELAEIFLKEIPNFNDRLLVKPGLTGYAQVNGGYEIKANEKIKYDLYYIQNLSFKLDLEIFFKTIYVLLSGDGAR